MINTEEMRIRGSNVITYSDTRIKAKGEDETLTFIYRWKTPEIVLGISFETLHSCLSATSPNDAVSFIITEESQTSARPYIIVRIENEELCYSYEHRVYLLLIENRHEIEAGDLDDFNVCLSIPSSLFLKVLRNSAKRAENVQIYTKAVGNEQRIFFRSSGDEAELLFSLAFDSSGECAEQCLKLDYFSLKYLLLITKATNLSSVVKLYLKDKHFLAIQYSIGNKSSVLFCLAPQVDRADDCPTDSVFRISEKDESKDENVLQISEFKRPVKRKRRKVKSVVVNHPTKKQKTASSSVNDKKRKHTHPKLKRPAKKRPRNTASERVSSGTPKAAKPHRDST